MSCTFLKQSSCRTFYHILCDKVKYASHFRSTTVGRPFRGVSPINSIPIPIPHRSTQRICRVAATLDFFSKLEKLVSQHDIAFDPSDMIYLSQDEKQWG